MKATFSYLSFGFLGGILPNTPGAVKITNKLFELEVIFEIFPLCSPTIQPGLINSFSFNAF